MTARIFTAQNSADRAAEAAFFNFVFNFYRTSYAYNVDGNITHIGFARPGTDTDETGWLIMQYTYDVDGNVTDKTFTNGALDFNCIFDDYATYDYS